VNAPDRRIWIDGALVPWEQATVHVLSHSLQRGSLIFDYMSVHETPRGAGVFRLGDHVDRFLHSAELVGLPLAYDRAAIVDAVVETVRANPGAKAVKVNGYLASIEVDVVPMDERVTLAIAAYDPLEDVIRRNPGEYERRPALRLWIEKARRQRRPDIVPAQAKVAANYTSPMAAKWEARRKGFDEILLVDDQGFVAEGPTTNVFWVDEGGTLRTPPEDNVLLGITRMAVIEIAKHEGIPFAESRIRAEELMEQPEVFLTGTTAGVWPVVSIDEAPVGSGELGPVAERLRTRFLAASSGEDPAFHHWLTFVSER